MIRMLVTFAAVLAVAAAASAELLPRPAALEPNVRFWTRIYSEVDADGGLIHDSEELEVVYHTLRFPEGLSPRARERRVERAKDRIRAALRELARGKRSGLSQDQARVLSRWPAGVSNATLRGAARRVRFQLGQADKFRDGLIRAGAWRGYIVDVLRGHGVPVELVALPHVESSFNPRAYSRVGAAGLWQFTRSTGRRFLQIDHVVDERMDPYRATEAAADLLQSNYRRLEAWPLAITAYNHGVAGMKRAMRKLGTRDIAEITRRYQSRSFGFASRNFYSEFLAALDVDRNAATLFGPFPTERPVTYDRVELDHYYPAASLARALRVERDRLREHNPALRPAVWNGTKYVPRGYALRIPKGSVARPLELALADVPAGERFARQLRDRYHKVRRGDTLSIIARRYGVRVSQLVALNTLRSRHRIRAGQVLILPDDARGEAVRVARQEPPADGVYRVRRGDNLSVIAARFGVSQTALARENGLRNRHVLHVGQRLRLPGHATQVASAKRPPPPETPARQDAAAAQEVRALPVVVASAATQPTAVEPPPAAEPPAPVAPEPERTESETPEAQPELAEPEAPEPERAEPETAETELAELDPRAPEPRAPVGAEDAESESPSPDPSNYTVTADRRIVVQAEETLGHYAEWLELRASQLRRLNRLRYETPLVIGRTLRLDFSRVTPETFEERRLAYHHDLQEDFFSSWVITGTRTHVLRRGDSLWYLAERKFRVPVWLLRQYNPDLDFGALPAGASMVVPEIQPRTS